ncbi:hypothetical protein [Staphylococcus aureus]|nr:hypothetical protein [Staphylococcus aureus]
MYFKNSSLNYIPTTFGGEPKKMNFNTTICL